MKTTSLLSRAALAALLAGWIVAPVGQAGVIIGTFGEWTSLGSPSEGSVSGSYSWGAGSSYTLTYGQTFTTPNDLTALNLSAVRFKLEYPSTTGSSFNFEAYVYEWDSVNEIVTGPRLNSPSVPPPGIAPGTLLTTFEIATAGVLLTPGLEYMVFLSTAEHPLEDVGGVSWGYLQAGSQVEPQASAAGAFYYNIGNAVDGTGAWTTSGYWTSRSPEDLAFELVLVPEPQMVGIITALGLLGFGWMRRRGVR